MIVATSPELYERAFTTEAAQVYPVIDALELRAGYALDRDRLESAARVLACPVKAHQPNWQHGRLLYAVSRAYCAQHSGFMNVLDVGTAKGFSALCLHWAIDDSGRLGQVTSVDVIDPDARVRRNTVAEVDGLKTLAEILSPWPEASAIAFRKATGIEWLEGHRDERIHLVFVDGKHSGHVVRREGVLLAASQRPGDVAVFDDMQIGDVAAAVISLQDRYKFEYIDLPIGRGYAIGRRR